MATPTRLNPFDPECRKCERLSRYLDSVRAQYPEYYCKPVPPFGDDDARLVVVGLAPGKHGANATGRPFTGDFAGVLLYKTLHKFGYASRAESLSEDDGLTLHDCRITNAVKCLPPQNKPANAEILQCNTYLQSELTQCRQGTVVLVLGLVAHKAVLKAFGLVQARFPFKHNQSYRISSDITLLDSYHCSRYNTQTRRLTEAMFEQVFEKAAKLLA